MSKRMRRLRRDAGLLLVVAGFLEGDCAFAQTVQRGLHYFAVENIATQRIEQRGEAGANGIAFDSLILAPNTEYRVWILQAATLDIGSVTFKTPGSGRRFNVPEIVIGSPGLGDSDGDELSDEGERIIGSDLRRPDTDADGIPDGTEVRQGLNPLGERIARTGIVGSVDTPGDSRDVDAFNDLVVVADSQAGVMLFNIFNGMQPMITGQVPTPGTTESLSLAGDLVAVADGDQGLAIVDISDPPAAAILHQIAIGGAARSVVLDGVIAFVGAQDGNVVAVDAVSGLELDRLKLSSRAMEDLRVFGEFLYVLEENRLHIVQFLNGRLEKVSQVDTPGGRNNDVGRMRLFVGGDIAYTVHRRGYNTIDVSDPTAPQLIQGTTTPQFGWKQIVLNGSGRGLAAVSPNQAFDGPHHVSLYDVTDPEQTDQFIAEFETPGVARALVIYNGIGYVADHQSGLHVLNYLAFDTAGMAPSIELMLPSGATEIEEGSPFLVRANVSDDVQVRNVEFYVNDRLVTTDGNFPFEVRLPAGRRGLDSQVRVVGRASDTGGNATFSASLSIDLLPDNTAPSVVRIRPGAGDIVGTVNGLTVFFSEAIALPTVNESSMQLFESGNDELLGTDDDRQVTGGVYGQNDAGNVVTLRFGERLPQGRYQLIVADSVTDQAGNALEEARAVAFLVLGQEDSDRDGIPDSAEADLGLDPFDPDTDDDGVPDGLEDGDNDGIETSLELFLGFNPALDDSDGDGILDADEDGDSDGLADAAEARAGTNLNLVDSDRDGLDDNLEVLSGTNPLSRDSVPTREISSQSVAYNNLIERGEALPSTHIFASPVHFNNEVGTPFERRTVPSRPIHFQNNL